VHDPQYAKLAYLWMLALPQVSCSLASSATRAAFAAAVTLAGDHQTRVSMSGASCDMADGALFVLSITPTTAGPYVAIASYDGSVIEPTGSHTFTVTAYL